MLAAKTATISIRPRVLTVYVSNTVCIRCDQTAVVGNNSAATTTNSGSATGMATSMAITVQTTEPEEAAEVVNVGRESTAMTLRGPCC